jgi:hypothetical protein
MFGVGAAQRSAASLVVVGNSALSFDPGVANIFLD